MFGWFKKKVTLTTPEGRVVRVPEARLDELIDQGHLKQVVEVIINDIGDGEKTERLVVGEDVDRETYERLKDEHGKLHMLTFYRRGKKEKYLTTREHYVNAREAAADALANEAANSIDLNFLREQAEKGDVNAQWMLAGLHAAGKRVPQDDVEAAKWYRRAAEQGNAASQMMLAILYFGGIGVPKDLCLACMWTTIAGRDGQVPIKELRDQVIGEMTPAQIAEAENLARDWKPTITNPALR